MHVPLGNRPVSFYRCLETKAEAQMALQPAQEDILYFSQPSTLQGLDCTCLVAASAVDVTAH